MLRKNLPILLLAVAGAHAHAQAVYVQQTPGAPYPIIHVYSDSATQWDRVGETQNGLTFYVGARGSCPKNWKTQHSSHLKVMSGSQNVGSAHLGINRAHQNYGPDHGQNWVEHTIDAPYVNPQSPNSDPVAVCNAQLAARSASAPDPAQRRRELLGNGFTHDFARAYEAEFGLYCADTGAGFQESQYFIAEANIYAQVQCHSNPEALEVPPPQRLPDPVGINSMDIWANPSASANYRGFCPKELRFGGEISYKLPANGNAVDLRYRYVATHGANVFKSAVFTTRYTATGKKFLKSWELGFPLMTGGPQLSATTNSGEPDVYGGNVALEFLGNPPINANLQPVQFNVTCLKEGQFAEAVMGGENTLGAATRPRDPGFPGGNPQPDPWQHTVTPNVNPNPTIPLDPASIPGSKDPAPKNPGQPAPGEPAQPAPGLPDPVIPSGGIPPGAVPAQQNPTQQMTAPTQAPNKRPPFITFPAQPTPGAATSSAAALKAGKPDLIIRSVERVAGSDRKLRVRIENIGTAPAPASRLTLLLPNGRPISVEIKPCYVASYQTGAIDAPIPLPRTALRLQIDDNGRVAEGNENNNTYVLTGVPHGATDTSR
jgi:CARDB